MKNALVVGGNSGLGLAISVDLLQKNYDRIYIVGKQAPNIEDVPKERQGSFEAKTVFYKINLNDENYTVFDEITDIDTLIITAGFGRVALFESLTETEIKNLIKCNQLGAIQIIRKYYHLLNSSKNFNCAVVVSIAGHIVSPYFSVYGAAKSGLSAFIKNVNVELAASGVENRILDVSPGALKGTSFNGGKNDLSQNMSLASEIIEKMLAREQLFIPKYEEIYKNVMAKCASDSFGFGLESYQYKKNSGRISEKPQMVVGYLSGTFDLFHIGHLNLIKRAKEMCDYLIVGVHESGSWKGKETFISFEERCEIVKSVRYVDRVVKSFREDSDAWDQLHFDKLFVGSDYKGTERFKRYEEYFADKNVEIVYFSYTQSTSSTKLRAAIDREK